MIFCRPHCPLKDSTVGADNGGVCGITAPLCRAYVHAPAEISSLSNVSTPPTSETARQNSLPDVVGVLLSGTCMIHCMLLPFAVAAFPLLQYDVLEEETFHVLMLAVVLPTSLGAFIFGAYRHRDVKTIALGLTALLLLVVAALLGHAYLGYAGERIATTVAGALLAAAHILNYRRSRQVHAGPR